MTMIDINALVAALRDVGVFAVLIMLTFYVIARSPFRFEITGTYRFSVGKNGDAATESPNKAK